MSSIFGGFELRRDFYGHGVHRVEHKPSQSELILNEADLAELRGKGFPDAFWYHLVSRLQGGRAMLEGALGKRDPHNFNPKNADMKLVLAQLVQCLLHE